MANLYPVYPIYPIERVEQRPSQQLNQRTAYIRNPALLLFLQEISRDAARNAARNHEVTAINGNIQSAKDLRNFICSLTGILALLCFGVGPVGPIVAAVFVGICLITAITAKIYISYKRRELKKLLNPETVTQMAERAEHESAVTAQQKSLSADDVQQYANCEYPNEFYGHAIDSEGQPVLDNNGKPQRGPEIMQEPYYLGDGIWCDKAQWQELPASSEIKQAAKPDYKLKDLLEDYQNNKSNNANYTFADYVKAHQDTPDGVPDAMVCKSFTLEAMNTPALNTASGHSYEKDWILRYVNEGGTDPQTRDETNKSDIQDHRLLTRLIAAFNAVKEWLANRPDAESDEVRSPTAAATSSSVHSETTAVSQPSTFIYGARLTNSDDSSGFVAPAAPPLASHEFSPRRHF